MNSERRSGTVIAMMWGWSGMAGGGWIFMVVFWVALIALIVWAVAALFPRSRGDGSGRRETPQDILDRRYARGELDAEAYRRMRDELRDGNGARR